MKRGSVTFIGAGPGDPELLTIKGKNAIEKADVVFYAGRHIAAEIIGLARPDAAKYDACEYALEESHAIAVKAARAGEEIVRIEAGDPAIYSDLAEQIELLERDCIPWRVIPGVTAALAVAARCGISFSLPGISQSLLITRLAGRVPMPAGEELERLAALRIPIALYIGGHECARMQSQLSSVLPQNTLVICASRVGWPDERILQLELRNLADAATEYVFGRQTLVFVLPNHRRVSI